jgi:hypothetical protein
VTMPNFLIIGAQKSGTTALYNYLKQHPQVYMSPVKEPHFFTYEGGKPNFSGPGRGYASPVTNVENYWTLFQEVSYEMAIGEASTSYLYSARALERIQHHVPEAKLIAILRNPAERAHSNYLHCVRTGREPLDGFEQALQAEKTRIRNNWGPIWHYKQKGFYYDQLKRYFDVFGPKQIRVYLYEDLREDPLVMLRNIFRFLGVDEGFDADVSAKHNISGVPKNEGLITLTRRLNTITPAIRRCLPSGLRRYIKTQILVSAPRLSPEVRGRLVEEYREDIVRLEELIQRDLSGWLR